jgi:hypothetical protein
MQIQLSPEERRRASLALLSIWEDMCRDVVAHGDIEKSSKEDIARMVLECNRPQRKGYRFLQSKKLLTENLSNLFNYASLAENSKILEELAGEMAIYYRNL